MPVFLIVTSSVGVVKGEVGTNAVVELMRIVQLVMVLLVVVRFIVVKGYLTILAINYAGRVVGSVTCQHIGGYSIPGLVGFFLSREEDRLEHGAFSIISA